MQRNNHQNYWQSKKFFWHPSFLHNWKPLWEYWKTKETVNGNLLFLLWMSQLFRWIGRFIKIIVKMSTLWERLRAYFNRMLRKLPQWYQSNKSTLFRKKRFALNGTLQNLLYFMYKKTHVVFFVFHFVPLYIFTLWMPWSMST